MKSDHSSTRIKTGKVAQDRNMLAWYRQQERIKQIEARKGDHQADGGRAKMSDWKQINPECKYYTNLSCVQCNKLGWGCRQGGLFMKRQMEQEGK